MNKRILALIIAAISVLLTTTIANAQPQRLTIWTDRFEYAPGETGTLYFVFYNDRASTVTIKRVMITFDGWLAYRNGQWEGNQTIEVNRAFISKEIYENNTKFTVPTDGRAKSTWAQVTVQTVEFGNIQDDYYVTVSPTPRYMEQIITLFTIQVILIIVCTIIVAATIFLSARGPQMVWKKEEKVQ